VLISPDKKQYLVSVKLQFGCTNNINEYEACILGFRGYIGAKYQKDRCVWRLNVDHLPS